MINLSGMPTAGIVVIVIILALFALSLVLLGLTCSRYRYLTGRAGNDPERRNPFLRYLTEEFSEAYRQYGPDTNTPAIIGDAVNTRLGKLLLCERFLSNSVSLFVTLGLFGTFLGLSLSVGSLTELISYSNTSEWLSVLDSVGGGLMSALSGMGVAFYTSLVGVACSILLTILRAIFNPASEREKMETRFELWLDQTVAPTLPTRSAKDDAALVHQMIDALNQTADAVDRSLKETTNSVGTALKETTDTVGSTLKGATADLSKTLDNFNQTVSAFNSGVHDFEDFNYNLSGTVERMDLAIRELTGCLRELMRKADRGNHE